ncbi:NucA/NucB deoxyribonuclease domain-containing protein [Paenibacillus sp. BR2-3]|uniref:DNA-entry nuclease n=1 Tax=Paenibacillus sp. BR2-3 TaxID=3048494 RepID=UPI003977E2CE
MKARKKLISLIILLLFSIIVYKYGEDRLSNEPSVPSNEEAIKLVFPSDRYPETARHIQDAIASGEQPVCTIDREGADENRSLSLKGVPTKKGYDRDEWPMAMCREGGEGADIEYIAPSDNRGAGSWVGNQLEDFADGTRVEFMFK